MVSEPKHTGEPESYPAYVRSYYDAGAHTYHHSFTYDRAYEIVIDKDPSKVSSYTIHVRNNDLSFEVKVPGDLNFNQTMDYAGEVQACLTIPGNENDNKDAERYRFIRNARISQLRDLMVPCSEYLKGGKELDKAVDELLH